MVLVIFILAVMLYPVMIHRAGIFLIRVLSQKGVIKKTDQTLEKWHDFVESYKAAVTFLKSHKIMLVNLMGITLVQRCTVFFVTYLVYRGFSLSETSTFTIMALQAAVYIAVDMLPVPGAQGITEMMYLSVFSTVFPAALLTPSMLVVRSVNFYILLLISLIVCLIQSLYQTE